ncbi:MAG: N-acetylmuramoyl-L-alanine amidase [Bacteroidia bacterium]|nr:N-acetylmuramoyl-L-alanine amidase [Bacteroidia bacterium]
MTWYYRVFLIILICLKISISNAWAQFTLTNFNNYYSYINCIISNEKILQVNNIQFTSIIIETNEKINEEIKVEIFTENGKPLFLISKFFDNENNREYKYSTGLHSFNKTLNGIKINFGNFEGQVKISFIYSPKHNLSKDLKLYKFNNPCDKPLMISYNEWRKGLPDPKPPREKTKVEHLVIHHSAGSNSDTDYINTVRNIYLLHTQSNGWDDIGYNFLIAPDGTIFNGRDPIGAGDDDEILGAHFCSKNQNTMGICIMGNYMNQKPTDEALFSLKYLLAWKLKKAKIDANGKTLHPKSTGSLLENICGHRNGCSTSCPGDSLYSELNKIRSEAARIADSCGLILDVYNFKLTPKIFLFPNPSDGKVYFNTANIEANSELQIFDISAKLIKNIKLQSQSVTELNMPKGLYFYKVLTNMSVFESDFFIIK